MKIDLSKIRLIAAAVAFALLLPLLAGCRLRIVPRNADAADSSGAAARAGAETEDNGEEDGGFRFSGTSHQRVYAAPDLPGALSRVNITADEVSGGYALPGTSFTVETASQIDAAELREYISITPAIEFDVAKKTDTAYSLTPAAPLDGGTLYRFTVGDRLRPQNSFVFQTDSALVVKSVLPADLAVQVPTNTGIEICFSEPPAAGTVIEDYFYITPAAEGEYMTYPDGKTVVFAPKKQLEKNTVYHVNVKAGLVSASGKRLENDYETAFRTASETYGKQKQAMISLGSYEPQFTASETPVIKFYVASWDKTQSRMPGSAKVMLYRYGSVDDVIEAMKEYESVKADYLYGGEAYVFPSDGLAEAGSYDITPVTAENDGYYGNGGYISLPRTDEGVYLVNITFKTKIDGSESEFFCQAIMQISDIIVYTEASGDSMLVWINDAAGGGTVSGAAVKAEFFTRSDFWNADPEKPVYKARTAVTDSGGLCHFDTGGDANAYVTVKKDGREAYVCASAYYYPDNAGWFSSLFTDREVYFSDDTVNFRGIIAPKDGVTPLPEALNLTLGMSKSAEKIKVLPDGSFSGSFRIEDYAGYGVYMSFTDDTGTAVAAKYIGVTQQSKPLYRASLTFDKLFYKFGDTVTLKLDATFYDGTPAPGLEFSLYGSYFIENNIKIKTGSDGTAKYSFKTAPYNFYSSYPVYLHAEAQLIGNEDETLLVSANAHYFHSRVRLSEKRIIPEDGGGTYTELYLNYYDTSAIKTKEDLQYPAFPENVIGAAAPGSVGVVLTEHEYIKEYVSTTYDPITKTSHENYSFRVSKRSIKNYTAQFTDGVLRLDHIKPKEDFNGYYMYTVSYTDADNKCRYELQIYANEGGGEYYNYQENDYYELTADKAECSVGDTVSVTLNYGKKPVKKGSILFTAYSDRLDLHSVTEKSVFSLIFEDKDAAGLAVSAAHFDGRRVNTAGTVTLSYNYNKNNLLNIEIVPDKDTYRPGENANVTVYVTDAAGRPVTGGNVTLSVVDEACFALGEQALNPLEAYYGGGRVIPYICRDARFSCFGFNYGLNYMADRAYGIVEETAPQTAAMDEAATADKGWSASAQEQVAVREIFSDNPLFETYAVSENGIAEISLKLPDNITEWRFTALAAYCPDRTKISGMNLGAAATGVICTLPFFADITLSETYVEGDDIAGHIRVYGTELSPGAAVAYTLRLTDESGAAIAGTDIDAAAGETARFNFGMQKSGGYRITAEAVCGTMSDGVMLPVEVIPEGIIADIRRFTAPSEIGSITPMMYPVSLTFMDPSYDGFFALCRSLMRGSTRSDALAAYYAAASVSETITGTSRYQKDKLDEIKAALSGYSGLIPLLGYSEGDLKLTAKICAIVPDALTERKKAGLARLFAEYISKRSYTDDAEMCAAYLALASLGEPVLDELYYIAEHSDGFTLEAKLYLAAALAYIGDYGAAAEYYDYITALNTAENENELRIVSQGTEESIMLTSLALITASVVDKADADMMCNYLRTHISSVNLYVLELAAYVRFFRPAEAKEAKFTYRIGETEETVTLSPGECHSIMLDRSDFAAFELISSDETVKVCAAYKGSAAEAAENGGRAEEIDIKKKIEPYDISRGLYKVTLSYRAVTDRSYAYFTLSDRIPSGARYFNARRENDINNNGYYTFAYISNDGGQAVNGCIGLYNFSEKAVSGLAERVIEGSVSYLIRSAFYGSFVIENAVVINSHTGYYATSDGGTVIIDDDGWTVK